MKILIFIALTAFLVVASGVFVPPRHHQKNVLLGKNQCTWGPSYWCQNLTSAADCSAVKHCIQTVWIHKELAPDTSNVCQICLDMVKQARDQLESNETQELIKQVFEGSCALIHIKPIVKECDKIADNYIPELIDTLASQMNPQIVCSVAGLCNNERIHQMIEDENSNSKTDLESSKTTTQNTCEGCHTVVQIMETKFNQMSPDEFLQSLLQVCRKTGSFSDACSNLIITYFTELYNHFKANFNPESVCLLSGECSAQFHTHANVEITPISHIGYVPVSEGKDDLPCDLCKQLIGHLRDILIANTTESEFKLVLEGLCKQTKGFKDECLKIVDEYYTVIYNFLVSELNASEVCIMSGICPNNNKFEVYPIVPLLPVETVPKLTEIVDNSKVNKMNMVKDGSSSVKILETTPEEAQLPIDLLIAPHTQVLYNDQLCVFCEYFLHYLQQVITSPKTEDNIKRYIDKACNELPANVNETCREFVDMYEPALVAILAQEIDPSQVCPLIKVCPSSSESKSVEIFMEQESDGSKCPLCLFAVTKLEEMVKDHKTVDQITDALSKLCSHLSNNLAEECNDFVNTYTKELVEMLIADFSPQEVCVYLKLCTEHTPRIVQPNKIHNIVLENGNIETNIIPDDTINGRPVRQDVSTVKAGPQCVICEFIMKELEDELKDKKTDEEIKKAVHNICNVMPKSVSTECNDFVNRYADTVIQLLIATLEPSQICSVIHLCPSNMNAVKAEVFECAICKHIVDILEKILDNPKVNHNIEHVLEKACRALPNREQEKCKEVVDKYGRTIYNLVIHFASKELICQEVNLCSINNSSRTKRAAQKLVGGNPCTWGPSYWCKSEANAKQCNGLQHCQEKVWLGSRPKRDTTIPGSNQCTWGPGFWCKSEENAKRCGTLQHCQDKVWLGATPNSRRKRETTTLLGSKKCTWGPGYWCASEANAKECNSLKHCQEKVWLGQSPSNNRIKRDTTTIPGSNRCTWGPGYWCKSEANAKECNSLKHCQEKVWLGARPNNRRRRETTRVGSKPCTWGPGYWCKNEANANECNAIKHCQEKVWLGAKPSNRRRRETAHVGSKPCTWGPGYWCKNEDNAKECNAIKHCQDKVWNGPKP